MQPASFKRYFVEPQAVIRILIRFLALALIMFCICWAKGQNVSPSKETDKAPTIEWVRQYPAQAGEALKKRFKDEVAEVFTGENPAGFLSKPVALAAVNPETLWILDQGNESIIRIEQQVGDMPHLRGRKGINFSSLVGICVFMDGKMLITDSYLDQIFVISPDKKEIRVLNDSLHLEQPTGIAYNPLSKEIWVSETSAHRVTVLGEDGVVLRRIGQRGSLPGEFNFPTSIWIDNSGTVFIVDAMNFRIQIFSEDGEVQTVFGEIGDATGYFARPKGIATDTYGNIYISDALFHTVQIFDRAGNFLYNFGRQGRDNGEFWMPSGIFVDESNYIYVADTYNSRVQVFRLITEK